MRRHTTNLATGSERCAARRSGSAYVLILGTAVLVTIIGVSALMMVRVERRAAEITTDGATARTLAVSAVDAAILSMSVDASWRSNLAHDTWWADQVAGSGTFTWKVVDEVNGGFTKDLNAPVRVHGRGECGDAVWILSVMVQPPMEVLPSNVLENGDLETGTTAPWGPSGACVLQTSGTSTHGGVECMRVTGRTAGSAAGQALGGLTNGTTCSSSVWVRTSGSTEDAWFGMQLECDATSEFFEFERAVIGSTWTQLSGTVTTTWSGGLTKAVWVVGTDASSEFYVDDASLVCAPATVGPVPGTWRRETP